MSSNNIHKENPKDEHKGCLERCACCAARSVQGAVCGITRCAWCGCNAVVRGASGIAQRAYTTATNMLLELKNPVVLLNLLLGGSAITYLLRGYAKYETRYLQGKTNGTIIATVSAAAALLTLDGLVSAKYYKKFDKKR